ncbi:MAG: GNAT family N-acetyltransferase [Nitrososphaerales archaeon]
MTAKPIEELTSLRFHVRKARFNDWPRVHSMVDSLSDEDAKFFHPPYLGFKRMGGHSWLMKQPILFLNSNRLFHLFLLALWPKLARIDLVAVDKLHDARILGLAYLSIRDKREESSYTAELGISIVQEARGKGLSNLLMTELLKQARAEEVLDVWLSVLAENHRAIKLYTKYGFHQTSTEIDVWQNNSCESLVMTLELHGK